jgi:hypothetical protein
MTVLQTLLDMYKSNNEELQAEVNRLRNEITATNTVNIQQEEENKDYRNLTQLHTLLMVIMILVAPHCDDSPLGQAVGKAIKKYQLSLVTSLAKDTEYVKDEDLDEWDDEDDEGSEIWRGEEE